MILPTRRWRVFYFQETSMSSNFERSQLTKIMISSAPVTAETLDSASYLGLSCTIKEVQFTAGQKQDIDVTTLCSVEQENINAAITFSAKASVSSLSSTRISFL